MNTNYTDIESTLINFADSYTELKSMHNDLMKALYGKLSVISSEEITNITIPVNTDAGYLKQISEAVKSRDAISALAIYEGTITAIAGVLESKQATVAKLSERILMQKDGPEVKVAVKRRAAINSDIEILRSRMEFCIERFYKLRKNVVDRIAKYSRSIASQHILIPDSIITNHILKNKIDDEVFARTDSAFVKESK